MYNENTKRYTTLWIRWSVLIMIIHTFILVFAYDFELFSTYSKTITLFEGDETPLWNLPHKLSFDTWYPRIVDILIFPLFLWLGLWGYQKYQNLSQENQGDIVFGLAFGLVYSLVFGLAFGLGYLLHRLVRLQT